MFRLVICLLLLVVGHNVYAEGRLEEFLRADPEAAAEKAFKSGDKKYIVLPVCGGGQVLPGWSLKESPEFWKAIESGSQPLTCKDYGDGQDRKNFIRASKHAARYNSKLLQLEGKLANEPHS